MKSNANPARGSIACHTLSVSDLDRSIAFYHDLLSARVDAVRTLPSGLRSADFRFSGPTVLALIEDPSRRTHPADAAFEEGYWKIGLTLPDVAAARAHLQSRGVDVSEPAQFEDVGYLCHLNDPDGYAIELVQHTFGPLTSGVARGDPFAGATLGQITLRVRDADASLAFYRDRLGMRLLSRQVIARYEFTLYFLGYTDETPPLADIDAIGNRPWLWQRPYTVLELQHRWAAASAPTRYRIDESSGFRGLTLRLPPDRSAPEQLPRTTLAETIRAAGGSPGERGGVHLTDPDGYAVYVIVPG